MYKNNDTARQLQRPTPERFTKPSKTVPDQTLSLKDLLRRHASGQNITILQPSYQAHDDYDQLLANIPNMNEMDRLDMARKLKIEGTSLEKKFLKQKKANDKIAAEQAAIKKQAHDDHVDKLLQKDQKVAKEPIKTATAK